MLFKNKKVDKIEEARAIATDAVETFRHTLLKLNESNEILRQVVLNEEDLIKSHRQNIQKAGNTIISNQYVIDKLKDFVPSEVEV